MIVNKIYFILLFSLLIVSCDFQDNSEDTGLSPQIRPAKLTIVSSGQGENLLNYPAVIDVSEAASLAFQVSGEVLELLVNELQKVEVGDTLASLDQRDYLAKKNSALEQFKNADAEYKRAVALYKEDAISKSILEQRKSQRQVNKLALDSAEKALSDTVLKSPISGVVAAVYIKKRELVKQNEVAILIHGTKGFEARINLPASVIATAKKNHKDKSFVILEAAPQRKIPTEFIELSLQADDATQTYTATFAFSAPDDLIILPGMNGMIWFEDPSKSTNATQALSIPLTAVFSESEQKFVWLVDQSTMTVSKKNVILEIGVGDTLNIVSGLEEGDMIVSAGTSLLSDGLKVRAWSK